jgi:hypothetical protein
MYRCDHMPKFFQFFLFSIIFGSFLFVILFFSFSPFQFLIILLYLSYASLLLSSYSSRRCYSSSLILLLLYLNCLLYYRLHISVILSGFKTLFGPFGVKINLYTGATISSTFFYYFFLFVYLFIILYCTIFFLKHTLGKGT